MALATSVDALSEDAVPGLGIPQAFRSGPPPPYVVQLGIQETPHRPPLSLPREVWETSVNDKPQKIAPDTPLNLLGHGEAS